MTIISVEFGYNILNIGPTEALIRKVSAENQKFESKIT